MQQLKKILVVDDVGVNRLIPGMILRPFGYEVHEVASGEAAIEALGHMAVDLVLLDLKMPGLSGQEVLASQRHLAANVRPVFVAYTAIDSDTQAQALLQSGFDHVLKKPATTVVLVDLVNTLLGQA
jgi:CheY-like chemotaxis protein